MHALKKKGVKVLSTVMYVWSYTRFFDLRGKLKFNLDFNSTLLSINGGGTPWQHFGFLIADWNLHLFTEVLKWTDDRHWK